MLSVISRRFLQVSPIKPASFRTFKNHCMMTTNMDSTNPKIQESNLVWVDCEMSGLDIDTDVLLEIAVIITDKDLNVLAEGPNLVIHQPDSVLLAMNKWCRDHHGASGLTQKVQESKLSLQDCESQCLKFVQDWTPRGLCPLAGNSVGQDARFLVKYMPNFMSHLHYRIIDVSTVKELARRWYPNILERTPTKKLTHRALDDIQESIEELRWYREKIFVKDF